MVKKKMMAAITATDSATKQWKMRFTTARMAYEGGELREAEGLLVRAMESAKSIKEKVFAVNGTIIGLGAVRLAMGRLADAKKDLSSAISALQSCTEPHQQELYAVALRFHADALLEEQNTDEAEKELLKALSILEPLGGEAAVQVGYTLCDLGALNVGRGRFDAAEKYVLGALDVLATALGSEDPEYVRASILYQICKAPDEEHLFEIADEGGTRLQYMLGAKHPNMLRAIRRYVEALRERGDEIRLEEAKCKYAAFDRAMSVGRGMPRID